MGVGDSGGRDGGFHGLFCSADVLYLQKTDLYLGLKPTWYIYVLVYACICVEGSCKGRFLIVSARVPDVLRIG